MIGLKTLFFLCNLKFFYWDYCVIMTHQEMSAGNDIVQSSTAAVTHTPVTRMSKLCSVVFTCCWKMHVNFFFCPISSVWSQTVVRCFPNSQMPPFKERAAVWLFLITAWKGRVEVSHRSIPPCFALSCSFFHAVLRLIHSKWTEYTLLLKETNKTDQSTPAFLKIHYTIQLCAKWHARAAWSHNEVYAVSN